MATTILIFRNLLALLGAYFIGSVNFATIIVKLKTKQQIRELYSKNPGATNVQRVLGKKWGITNAILDMSKVPVAMLWAFSISLWTDTTSQQHYFNYISYYWPALVALVGHIYPIFHKFQGGRGVSCFWGMAVMFNPWWGLIFGISWISVCALLKKVAYASIISTSFTSIMAWVPQTSSIENQQLKVAYSENYQFLFHQKIIWFNQLQQMHGAQQGDLLITIQLAITLATLLVIMRHRVYLSKKNKTL